VQGVLGVADRLPDGQHPAGGRQPGLVIAQVPLHGGDQAQRRQGCPVGVAEAAGGPDRQVVHHQPVHGPGGRRVEAGHHLLDDLLDLVVRQVVEAGEGVPGPAGRLGQPGAQGHGAGQPRVAVVAEVVHDLVLRRQCLGEPAAAVEQLRQRLQPEGVAGVAPAVEGLPLAHDPAAPSSRSGLSRSCSSRTCGG
jgi:hypothetical protein